MLSLAKEPAVAFHRMLLLPPFKFNFYEQSAVAIITFLKRSNPKASIQLCVFYSHELLKSILHSSIHD
ncbi:hypothetical protein T4E_10684 [Trichinella pseudospiralis]|uniref:Uncharacterized protein n=1 Tax=Trichinella pseudospiralis TaxID=6337 RepID=A0A0V0Y0J0_TRIPS|nr:hypothetical protein T4E_10684 [Trichinella pseudospiralis]